MASGKLIMYIREVFLTDYRVKRAVNLYSIIEGMTFWNSIHKTWLLWLMTNVISGTEINFYCHAESCEPIKYVDFNMKFYFLFFPNILKSLI